VASTAFFQRVAKCLDWVGKRNDVDAGDIDAAANESFPLRQHQISSFPFSTMLITDRDDDSNNCREDQRNFRQVMILQGGKILPMG